MVAISPSGSTQTQYGAVYTAAASYVDLVNFQVRALLMPSAGLPTDHACFSLVLARHQKVSCLNVALATIMMMQAYDSSPSSVADYQKLYASISPYPYPSDKLLLGVLTTTANSNGSIVDAFLVSGLAATL